MSRTLDARTSCARLPYIPPLAVDWRARDLLKISPGVPDPLFISSFEKSERPSASVPGPLPVQRPKPPVQGAPADRMVANTICADPKGNPYYFGCNVLT